MFFIDPVSITATAFMLAGMTGSGQCIPPTRWAQFDVEATTDVNIDPNQLKYYGVKRKYDGKEVNGPTNVMVYNNIKSGGFTFAKLGYTLMVDVEEDVDQKTGKRCMWLGPVKVSVLYSTKTYVAWEAAKSNCVLKKLADETAAEIVKDEQTLKKYESLIEAEIQKQAIKIGSFGPVTQHMAPKVEGNLKAIVKSTVERGLNHMLGQMRQSHAVDTDKKLEEMLTACPDAKEIISEFRDTLAPPGGSAKGANPWGESETEDGVIPDGPADENDAMDAQPAPVEQEEDSGDTGGSGGGLFGDDIDFTP